MPTTADENMHCVAMEQDEMRCEMYANSRKRPFQNNSIESNQLVMNPAASTMEHKTKPSRIRIKYKKQRLTSKPSPVYEPNVHPARALNELYSNLLFKYESNEQANVNSSRKFKCNLELMANNHLTTFSCEGYSKKEAKRNCCYVALMNLYPESYFLPANILNSLQSCTNDSNNALKAELAKRIYKLISQTNLNRKNPSQLLHEVNVKISETGRCVLENGYPIDRKFAYQYTNINGESFVFDSNNLVVVAFGKFKSKLNSTSAKL
jgi:hypothetical protein